MPDPDLRALLESRPTVAAFIAELLYDGREAATARARQLALRRFAAWLAEEGELDADPLAGLKPPKLDSKVVPVLGPAARRRAGRLPGTGADTGTSPSHCWRAPSWPVIRAIATTSDAVMGGQRGAGA